MVVQSKLFQVHICERQIHLRFLNKQSYYIFLAKENPMEVSTIFTGGKFRTSIHFITKWHSLSPSSHTFIIL